MNWRAGQFTFRFPRPTLVMGILNVTPDSFSDGGKYFSAQAALDRAARLVREGADIIDVGGESTRPRATPVPVEEELRRVIPVIEALAGRVEVPISIDTVKPEVAEAALAAGASIVNDVGANRGEESMWRVVARAGAGYVCMHMQGTPETMQKAPRYGDVTEEVGGFFRERLERCVAAGMQAEQVALDVGVGFGKTLEHNLQLLRDLRSFTKWQRPLLLGVSRKSFLGLLLGTPVEERLPAALACSALAIQSGAHILRVHDVAATVQAARMTEAILARDDDVGNDPE